MKATTSLFHDLRYKKKDGTYPVKLCVIFNRRNKLYNTGISLSAEDWEKVNSAKPRGDLKNARIECGLILKKADKIIESLPDFSFSLFEKKFLRDSSVDVYSLFDTTINKLNAQDRAATADSYKCALNSFIKFKSSLQFDEVTPDFLSNYENWMLKHDNSITTVGIYLRALRAIMNEAKEERLIKPEQYPFGKRKYQVPAGRNIKKALTIAQIEKIFNYKAEEGTPEDRARDFWIFSYLCNGANIKDIANLRWSNISGDKIIFIRAKTKRTSRSNPKPIVAILTKDSKAIIKKWGNEQNGNNYIFPILSEGITAIRERKLLQNFIKLINNGMRRIGDELGIENISLTTYSARHSFSTVLKRSGVSTEFISESLGHSDLKTTENYLDSFEDTVKKEYANKLTAFNKIKNAKASKKKKK